MNAAVDWRHLPVPDKLRLRWRLLTDLHPEPDKRRPEQLTPDLHVLCTRDDAGGCSKHVDWELALWLGGRGSGKPLAADTLIPTPDGWRRIDDLQVGDCVFAHDGTPTRVLASYDPGTTEAYRVTFADGSTLVAGATHEWVVLEPRAKGRLSWHGYDLRRVDPHWWRWGAAHEPPRRDDWRDEIDEDVLLDAKRARASGMSWDRIARMLQARFPHVSHSVIERRQLRERVGEKPRRALTSRRLGVTLKTTQELGRGDSIPLALPLQLPARELSTDPYVFGLWLGDGAKGTGDVCAGPADADWLRGQLIAHGYAPDVERVDARNGVVVFRSYRLRKELKARGVREKWVPPEYLRASVEQRLALVRGLMDTDGSCARNGVGCGAGFVSKEIADALFELAISLGWMPRRRVKMLAATATRPRRPFYGVDWRAVPSMNPFLMPRKAVLVTEMPHDQAARKTMRMIVAVEPVDDVPLRCIAIAHESRLFLAGEHMIPTHNTRCGAEDVADFALRNAKVRVHLVAPTFADVRDTMYEGDSGLLSVIPEALLLGGSRDKAYNRSLGELFLDNGSVFKGFSSETPQRLRGPQCHRAWFEELATWKDVHLGEVEDTTYSNAMLGLRLGNDPKVIVTTTPKNNRLVKEILYENPDDPPDRRRPNPNAVVVRMSTYRNAHNLAPQFRNRILRKYEGTRAGRQEIHAELIDDVEGALWSRDILDRARVTLEQFASIRDSLRRVATAVDPAMTSNNESDDTGIVTAGVSRGRCPLCPTATGPHAFIFRDDTCHLPPHGWARRAIETFDAAEADVIVGEVNNGGDLVETNVRAARENVPFKQVRASRGKAIRAEPVATLFGGEEIDVLTGQPTGRWLPTRVHIVGHLPALEDQCCTWDPDESSDSPDRVDAMVWAIWYLMLDQINAGGPGSLAKRAPASSGAGRRVPTSARPMRERKRRLRRGARR